MDKYIGDRHEGIEMQNFFLRMKNELEEAGLLSASFEMRQIISAFSGEDFYEIRLENEFPMDVLIQMEDAVKRRVKGEPLQYILGECEFMGLPVKVGAGVFIPRPETEHLTENALDFLDLADSPSALDLCCGSGCIGISVKKLLPKVKVTCADLYDTPLEYAEQNARLNDVDITIIKADATGLPPELPMFDAIISNPPHIAAHELDRLEKEGLYESRGALDGGDDGLDFYRAIIGKWSKILKPKGKVMFEAGVHQAKDVAALLAGSLYEGVAVIEDYAGAGQIVVGTKKDSV